jgi:hypothetical protein
MTWEEDSIMERLRHLLHGRSDRHADLDARRKRSNRMRYFLTVFGATHWADRVDGRRAQIARRGHIAL